MTFVGRDGSDRDASPLNGFLPAVAAAVRHLGERGDGVSGKRAAAAAMTTSSAAAAALQSPADRRMKVTSDKRAGFCQSNGRTDRLTDRRRVSRELKRLIGSDRLTRGKQQTEEAEH